MVLSVARFGLVISSRRINGIEDKKKHLKIEWKSYRFTGYMLTLTGVILLGMVIQMVVENRGYVYEGMLILVVAAYDFCCLGNALVYLIRKFRKQNPLIRAVRMISFVTSLVAILSLQTAMFVSFGADGDPATHQLMNGITGVGVCLLSMLIGLMMVRKAQSVIKKL